MKKPRVLSSPFLVTILTEEGFLRATPYAGVRIAGACINGAIDLGYARLDQQLRLIGCRFSDALCLEGASIKGWISLEHSWLGARVSLVGANICGSVALSGGIFNGKLEMDFVEIGGSLFMQEGARFNQVDLRMAKIDGQINMNGSSFGSLDMQATQVGMHVLMRDARFKKAKLTSAKIGLSIHMEGGTFEEELLMPLAQVSTVCLAESASFPEDKTVDMRAARFGALNLSKARISNLDLTDATISHTLLLGCTKWRHGSRMRLRNTTVGAFQDGPAQVDSWPGSLELEGFSYSRLGGWDAPTADDLAERDEDWFIHWLGRDAMFSPQPYEQLASVLRQSGSPSKANAILYAARQRSRQTARKRGEWPRWFGLLLLDATIGYGLGVRYFRVLWWFGVFTVIGFLLLLGAPERCSKDHFDLAWASFINILPFVALNDKGRAVVLETDCAWITAYFYVQRLIGYVLGGFLVAGLTGLTQSEK